VVIGQTSTLHKTKPEFPAFRRTMAPGVGTLAMTIQATSTAKEKEKYPEISFQIKLKWTIKMGIYFQS